MAGRTLFLTLVLVTSTAPAAPVPKALKKTETEAERVWRESGLPPTIYPEIDPEAPYTDLPEVVIDGTEVGKQLVNKRVLLATLRQAEIIERRIAVGQFAGTQSKLVLVSALDNVRTSAKGALDSYDAVRPWLAHSVQRLKRLELDHARVAKAGDEDVEKMLPEVSKHRQAAEEDLRTLDNGRYERK